MLILLVVAAGLAYLALAAAAGSTVVVVDAEKVRVRLGPLPLLQRSFELARSEVTGFEVRASGAPGAARAELAIGTTGETRRVLATGLADDERLRALEEILRRHLATRRVSGHSLGGTSDRSANA
jgi:hypothetical protein